MNALRNRIKPSLAILLGALLVGGCVTMGSTEVALTGDQEVPPVTTAASGTANVTIGADKSVSGTITTSGIAAVAAHIHDGAPGKNGPVIIPFTKSSDNMWSIAAGAKLTDAQYDDYKAGNLYVNVHSAAHKGGEIRGQIKP